MSRSMWSMIVFVCVAIAAPAAHAQSASSSAYGERVDVHVDGLGAAAVDAESGPLPEVAGTAPPPYSLTDSLAGVGVDGTVVIDSTAESAVSVETGLLEVSASGSTSPLNADAEAQVANVAIDLGASTLIQLLLALDADAITATAEASGTCGGALTASGNTSIVNGSASGQAVSLAGLGVSTTLAASPAPNTVLLDVAVGGGNIRIVLNEQFVTGNGTDSRGIIVNAIHIYLTNVPLQSLGPGATDVAILNGDIVIGHAQARVACAEAGAGAADLSLTKSDSADPATVGVPFDYELTVTNAGPDTATDVVLIDTIPASVDFVSASATQGFCTRSGRTVTCQLGDLDPTESAVVTITVVPTEDGVTLTNVASVSASQSDPDPSDNTALEETVVGTVVNGEEVDLQVVLNDSPDPATVGETITYVAQITDTAVGVTPTDVTLTETLSPGLVIESVTPSSGTCVVSGQTITCELGDVDTATVTVEARATSPGTVGVTAIVSSDQPDLDPSDNVDTETTQVLGQQVGPPVTEIPTLGEWGMMLLALLLGAGGLWALRRT